MVDNREKVILTQNYYVESGYYDEHNRFIKHSFDDEPSKVYNNGSKFWYEHDIRYWFINNKRYNTIEEVYEKYRDKIIYTDGDDFSQVLTNMNIDFIYLVDNIYLIFDDSDINELILRYG